MINWHSFFFLLFALIACVFALAVVLSSNIVRMAFYLIISLGAVAGLFFLAGADFVGAMQLVIYVGGTLVLLVFGVMLTARGPFVTMKTGGGQWVLAVIAGASLLAVLLQAATSVAWLEAERTKQPPPEDAGSHGRDAVTAVDDSATTQLAARIDVLANDSFGNADLDAISVSRQGRNGLAVVNPDRTVTYTPNFGFTGSDSFTYTIKAGEGNEATATVSVTVARPDATSSPLGLGLLGVRVDKLDEKNETIRQGMSGYLLPFEIVSVHLLVVLIGAAYLARAKRRRPRTKDP
jgi:NADH:ubiquinone oxidoreductase subunit 6 (subunit J)